MIWALLLPLFAFAEVKNPSMFIGEVVQGAPVNNALFVDSAGKLAAGAAPIVNAVDGSTTASSCTTTAAVLNGMAITVPAKGAGTYLAIFSSDFSSSNAGNVVTLSFTINGTVQAVTIRKFMPYSGGALGSTFQRVVGGLNAIFLSLNDGDVVAVNCSTSSNTSTTASMEFDLVRLK